MDSKTSGLYDRDFYSWAVQQAAALQRRDFGAIDLENLIEEIEDLGASRRNEWETLCARLIQHLLKIEYRDRADEWVLERWEHEITGFRKNMAKLIKKNPGLQGVYGEMFAEAWADGRSLAADSLTDYAVDPLCRKLKTLEPRSEKAVQLAKSISAAERDTRRKWNRDLPRECPYRFEHVTAFDAKTDREPREDVWPPAAARILNDRLGTDYPLLSDAALRGKVLE